MPCLVPALVRCGRADAELKNELHGHALPTLLRQGGTDALSGGRGVYGDQLERDPRMTHLAMYAPTV